MCHVFFILIWRREALCSQSNKSEVIIKNINANIYTIDKNVLQLHISLYDFSYVLHDVIIWNKVNNYLYGTYHNNVIRTLLLLLMLLCWVQASHYWLGTVIQKTSIEKSYEKHLNNDFQFIQILKVIRTDSIRGLSNFNETKIFKKRFAEPTWAIVCGSSFNSRFEDW